MPHLNSVRFPDRLASGVVYGPEFVTEIVPTISGREKRNRVRRNALCVGECSHIPTLREDYPDLLRFFRGVNGRFSSWRFKDFTDYECTFADGVLEEIDSTHFQLCKLYEVYSGFDEVRVIQAPIAAGFVLRDGSTTLTLTTDYTLDTATGIVTTPSPRSAGSLSWSGTFDNVCRFDTDRMAVSAVTANVFTWGGIPIREVRL
jgi:uncharacterized protein (TIGR02217 family)